MQSKIASAVDIKIKLQAKSQTFFAGVDPHKKQHVLSAITPFGDLLASFSFDNSVSGFRQAESKLNSLSDTYGLTPMIGIEDTGGNGYFFAEYLVKRGFAVKTVSPILVDGNRRKSTHPEKSDSRDAEEVAKVLLVMSDRLPDFILSEKSDFAKDLNLLVKDREHLVKEQTKLKNKLHAGLQNTWGSMYKDILQKDIFGKRAIEFFLLFPSARDFKEIEQDRYKQPDLFKKLPMEDLPRASEIYREHIKRHLSRLREIQEEIRKIEKLIRTIVRENFSYLLTLRGCGIVNASKLLAEINDIERFANDSKLARYSGIAPVKKESGETKKDALSKRGNVRLREVVKSIALTQIRKNGDQIGKAYYRRKLNEGKNKKQALRCLMRQLTKILFKMVKEQRPYY
jgi:transposase